MNIPDLMNELVIARRNTQSAYEVYKACKETENEIRNDLLQELRDTGLKSVSDSETGNTAAILKREQIKVTSETKVMQWLKDNPSMEVEQYISLHKAAFEPVAKAWLKQTGEVIPGTEIVDNEYLAIKEKK